MDAPFTDLRMESLSWQLRQAHTAAGPWTYLKSMIRLWQVLQVESLGVFGVPSISWQATQPASLTGV